MSTSATEDRINRARELGLPTPEDLGNEEKTPLPHVQGLKDSQVEPRLTAEEVITREAILDVIDDKTWLLYQRGNLWAEDRANADRLDFADAVIARARQIKQVDAAIALEKKRINDPD